MVELDSNSHLKELTIKSLTLLHCGLVKTSSGVDDPGFQKSLSDINDMSEFILAIFELIQACMEKNLNLMKTIYSFADIGSILKLG